MAKLPEQFEENNQLKNMDIGDSGYIVPWGMWMDLDGNCFLNESYTHQPNTGGTVQLKITRVIDGYIAHIHEMQDDYKWEKQSSPGYMSAENDCYGPVVGFDKPKTKSPQTLTLREISNATKKISFVGKLRSLFSSN